MGIVYAICAYVLWGILPIFWKQLKDISSVELIFHRMLWTFCFIWLFLIIRNRWKWLRLLREKPKLVLMGLLASVAITSNWFVFIWAINSGYLVEASLGYFINPLIFVLLGVFMLGESLRKIQIIAIGFAAMGVFYLTFVHGNFPFLALFLAFSFTIYGLVRKFIPFDSFEGLALEMSFVLFPSLVYIVMMEYQGKGSFIENSVTIQTMIVSTGIITAIPLLFFAAAAKRVPFYNLGFFQYIAPTIQFLLGVFVYGEAFPTTKLIGFVFIWVALVIYSAEAYFFYRRKLNLQSIAT